MVGSSPHFVGNCNGGVVFFQAVCIYLKKKGNGLAAYTTVFSLHMVIRDYTQSGRAPSWSYANPCPP